MRETHLISSDLKGTRFRTISVIVSVAVLVSLLFSTSVLGIAVRNATQTGSEKLGADMIVLPPLSPSVNSFEVATTPIFEADAGNGFLDQRVLPALASIPGIAQASPQLYVGTLNSSGTNLPLKLIAFDPKTDFVVRPWDSYPEENLQSGEAIAGAGTGLSVGRELAANGITLKIVAVLDPTNSSLDQTVFFPLQTAYRLAGVATAQYHFRDGQISGVLLNLSQDAQPPQVESGLQYRIAGFTLVEATGLVSRVRVDTTGIASYQFLVEIIMAASVFVLMASIFSMTTNERSRQLGLLRSLGATRRFIFGNVLAEAGLMALIGGTLGLAIGELVVLFGAHYLVATFNIPFIQPSFLESLTLSATSVALGVAVGTAASTIPAYLVSRRDPYDGIRRGE